MVVINMMIKEENYRGLIISTNRDTKFENQPIYYTILNPNISKNGQLVHVHCKYKSDTIHIVDCFQDMNHGKWFNMSKYKNNHRNLAMALFGLPMFKNSLNCKKQKYKTYK